MKARILLLLGIVYCLRTVSTAQNINISNYTFHDMEPYIAVNPTNPNNVITAWMKLTGVGVISIAVSSSSDGGITWSTPSNIPHLYPGFTHADVSMAFNSSGKVYISYIDYDVDQDSGYVMVANSTDGGLSWSTPVKAISAMESVDFPVDRPWIEVDRSGGTYDGRIYLVSKSISGALPYHIWMKTSSDGGMTWSALKQIDSVVTGDAIGSMGALAVGSDGDVYVGYISYDNSASPFVRLLVVKSVNGGTNFMAPYVAGYAVAGSAINDTLQGSITLSANPTDPNNLVFTFTDARFGEADILSVRSTNGGVSWSSPIVVNDNGTANNIHQDMSWAGFSPNGTYMAAWRDRRNGGTSVVSPFEIWVAASQNGGTSFLPNYKISTALSPDIPIEKGNDFIGIGMSTNYVHLAWCDNRTGNFEVFTNKESISTVLGKTESTQEITEVIAYPNPTNGRITIEFSSKIAFRVKPVIYDAEGKIVQALSENSILAGPNKIEVDAKNLSKGSYVFSIEHKELKLNKTFIRQ